MTRRVLIGALLLSACTWSTPSSDALDSLAELPQASVPPPSTAASSTPATTEPTPPAEAECEEREMDAASLLPLSSTEPADGTFMAELREQGHMRVGLDENTRGFSSRDPVTGELEGFEVGLAHEIARRVFADAYRPGVIVEYPVDTDEKVRLVEEGALDLSIDAISMRCDRWDDVLFSAEYFRANQELLVRSDSTIRSAADLDGRTVCVTVRSSSKTILEQYVPDAVPLVKNFRTDCLRAVIEGEADAYFGHDSFIYGMLDQDRQVELRRGVLPADAPTTSHYGIAVSHEHPEFVRFINAVLEEIIADGTWDRLHDDLEDELDLDLPDDSPPDRDYRRGLTWSS